MAKTNFIAHPYDSAFKSLLVRGSPLITVPFINELFIAEADKNNFKVKITDALLIINGKAYHIECDCYKRNRIILNVTEYDLGSGLNNKHLSKTQAHTHVK